VPEAKWPRVALPVALPNGTLPRTQDTRHITGHFQGNTGLVSSASDYLRFTMMLLRHGALDRVRVLGGGRGYGASYGIWPGPCDAKVGQQILHDRLVA
jgi:hypothetical protein